jgi:hypothetical protein
MPKRDASAGPSATACAPVAGGEIGPYYVKKYPQNAVFPQIKHYLPLIFSFLLLKDRILTYKMEFAFSFDLNEIFMKPGGIPLTGGDLRPSCA